MTQISGFPSLSEQSLLKFEKFKELVKPYQEIFLYKHMLLVAHDNIISYFNIEKKEWKCHHKFDSDDQETTTTSIAGNRVRKVFRYETKDSSQYGIGVLFTNGTISKIKIKEGANGRARISTEEHPSKIKGKIIDAASD